MAKKKVNRMQQQKLVSAQHRKVFMQKLRTYCTMMGGASLFDEIPELVRDVIYYSRGASCKIRVAEGAKITKRFVKILYAHLNGELQNETIEILPDSGIKVSLFDYFQIVSSLEGVLLSKSVSFKGEEKFNALRDVAGKNYDKYTQRVGYLIFSLCYSFGDLSKHCLYTFTYDVKDNFPMYNNDFRKLQLVTLGTIPLDVRHVKLNEEWRPVCQVGKVKHANNTSILVPAEAPLKHLGIYGAKPGEKAPVYIQQHAVDRIMKRAYFTFPGDVTAFVYKTFYYNRKIISTGKNQYLIECFYDDMKIGYFSAVYVDGILVIRTFLLITHSGTPEGKKLEQLTGLQKKDTAYLAINDLRSLANSDILDNDDVRKIFTEAGCESIIELCRRVREGYENDWLLDKTAQNKELSKMILEYIRLGANDEEYFVNEDD
jgi:hypothetical protein